MLRYPIIGRVVALLLRKPSPILFKSCALRDGSFPPSLPPSLLLSLLPRLLLGRGQHGRQCKGSGGGEVTPVVGALPHGHRPVPGQDLKEGGREGGRERGIGGERGKERFVRKRALWTDKEKRAYISKEDTRLRCFLPCPPSLPLSLPPSLFPSLLLYLPETRSRSN